MDLLAKRADENDLQYIWRLCSKKDNGEITITWPELANVLNKNLRSEDEALTESAYRKKYQSAKDFYENVFSKENNTNRTPEDAKRDYLEEAGISNGCHTSRKLIELNEEQMKDEAYILKAHGFDPKFWKVASVRNTIREVFNKQDGATTLYSSFLTAKPSENLTLQSIEEFFDRLGTKYNPPVVKRLNFSQSDFMLEIPIFDLHFGKLSRSEDVNEPYNYNLAVERFNYVIDDVIQGVGNTPLEKIIFPIGSDFFHVDNMSGSTTAGTPQTSDLSPQLIFEYGMDCLISGIEKLATIAPVEVFCVNGNHDFLTSQHAIYALGCYFKNNENVTVDKGTSPRKYIEFGNCLIGFSHGDKEKKRIDGLMQIEAREAWGRTLFHEFHMGHLHSEQAREANGIIFRNLSSVVGSDSWHHINGYVGALKKSQSFIWDKENGLKNMIMTTIN